MDELTETRRKFLAERASKRSILRRYGIGHRILAKPGPILNRRVIGSAKVRSKLVLGPLFGHHRRDPGRRPGCLPKRRHTFLDTQLGCETDSDSYSWAGIANPAVHPPSMTNSEPVEYDEASEANHVTNSAASSGRPIRPKGIAENIWSIASAGSASVTIGVLIPPGCTEFDAIPNFPKFECRDLGHASHCEICWPHKQGTPSSQ